MVGYTTCRPPVSTKCRCIVRNVRNVRNVHNVRNVRTHCIHNCSSNDQRIISHILPTSTAPLSPQHCLYTSDGIRTANHITYIILFVSVAVGLGIGRINNDDDDERKYNSENGA